MTNESLVPNDELFDELVRGPLHRLEPLEQEIFLSRVSLYWPDADRALQLLYSDRSDYEYWCRRLLELVAARYAERSAELRLLDLQRQGEPDWFQQPTMLGYVCYVDKFAGTLRGVAERVAYFSELGITYLHLMPLLKPRSGPNDGGYAVVDYRAVNPELGDMNDLAALATVLRQDGISLCIDLVCNHTAKEHEWAQRALAGDPVYQDYYLMYPDRGMPDRYEKTLPEIFPEFKPGNFTYYPEIERWVWTTFNEFQWDLNYRNPAVLGEMLDIILFLANQGVEVLRMDAVAFMWKRLGTDCQNQPEAHAILQAFRALSRMAAPGLLLKAEAIVAPDKLVPYLGTGEATNRECELAYHNVYMVLLWSSLAEGKAVLMTRALQNMPPIPTATSWVTYVRCHDDIGWAVSDQDAAEVGLSGTAHRAFLSEFYSGRFPDTFARGATFQHNPRTGDRRISGACGSLAGLELALEQEDAELVERSLHRILLLYNLILAFGGIPLIYMGDELGMLNDTSYLDDPDLAGDNRWLHRSPMDWELASQRHRWDTIPGRLFRALEHMVRVRQETVALHAQAGTYAVWTHNERVFGLLRDSPRGRVLVLANFSDRPQQVPGYRLAEMGLGGALVDLLTDHRLEGTSDVHLAGYEVMWLTPEEQDAPSTVPAVELLERDDE